MVSSSLEATANPQYGLRYQLRELEQQSSTCSNAHEHEDVQRSVTPTDVIDNDPLALLQKSVSLPMRHILEHGQPSRLPGVPSAFRDMYIPDDLSHAVVESQHLVNGTATIPLRKAAPRDGGSLWVFAPAEASPGLDDWDTADTVLFILIVVVLLIFDMFLAPQSDTHIYSHALAFVFMAIASGVFCAIVWIQRGHDDGVAWATGYALELALSMDNLFVFHLVFKNFAVPKTSTMRALSFGIYGAVCFRVVFILGLTQLFTVNPAIDIGIGLVLVASGLMTLWDDDDEDVRDSKTSRFFTWLFGSRLVEYNDAGDFFTSNEDGQTQITELFLVVCVISAIDCIFAVDSVGSKTGQIKNSYINLTSSLMGMFCLRSLFFIIRDMADHFDYVKYGICSILCFVGLDMVFQQWVDIPLPWMCVTICILFASSLVASVAKHTWYPTVEKDVEGSDTRAHSCTGDTCAEDTDSNPASCNGKENGTSGKAS